MINPNFIVTPKKAIEIQEKLKDKIIISPLKKAEFIAGFDVSFDKRSNDICCAAVVLEIGSLGIVETAFVIRKTEFPYISGLLSFREGPAIIDSYKKLKSQPDVLMFDGQGLAHPRRFGLACHMGLLLDKPSYGVAKTHLLGDYDEPGNDEGSSSCLLDNGEKIGAVVRTRTSVKPVYVSIGYKVTLTDAIDLTLKTAKRYRVPEPIRQAHILANKKIRN